jgi:hypothetical protein
MLITSLLTRGNFGAVHMDTLYVTLYYKIENSISVTTELNLNI